MSTIDQLTCFCPPKQRKIWRRSYIYHSMNMYSQFFHLWNVIHKWCGLPETSSFPFMKRYSYMMWSPGDIQISIYVRYSYMMWSPGDIQFSIYVRYSYMMWSPGDIQFSIYETLFIYDVVSRRHPVFHLWNIIHTWCGLPETSSFQFPVLNYITYVMASRRRPISIFYDQKSNMMWSPTETANLLCFPSSYKQVSLWSPIRSKKNNHSPETQDTVMTISIITMWSCDKPMTGNILKVTLKSLKNGNIIILCRRAPVFFSKKHTS